MRLLCADDEADIRLVLEMALGLDPEVSAVIVPSGIELLARAEEGWDAFILDGMMPGLDGYETCQRLKANPATRDIPVIFLSAKTYPSDIERARGLGALASLPKPFDPMTIAADIRAVLERAAAAPTSPIPAQPSTP